MTRLEPAAIAAILLTKTAGWARVALTARDPRLRQRAAAELALTIVDHLDDRPAPDHRQIALPL